MEEEPGILEALCVSLMPRQISRILLFDLWEEPGLIS